MHGHGHRHARAREAPPRLPPPRLPPPASPPTPRPAAPRAARLPPCRAASPAAGACELAGISAAKQAETWQLLGGLLLLANVDFTADANDKAVVATPDVLGGAEELLGCANLTVNLTTKGSGRKSLGALKLSKLAAEATRDAAIKDIYVHIFDWVVGGINQSIGGAADASKQCYIGLLDIFGFEVFKFNSFEQLCINFTNEKLQAHFMDALVKLRMLEYEKEGVPHSSIECVACRSSIAWLAWLQRCRSEDAGVPNLTCVRPLAALLPQVPRQRGAA